jgi:hypothetical protein
MNALDELTLKLLTSKKKYNNYLANMMPDKSAEIKTFYDKVAKMRPRIQTLLGKYLDDPATQTTNELDDVIEQCLRTVVKHLEMRDYEDKCARKGYDETDSSEEEVVLFGQADEASLDATGQASLHLCTIKTPTLSAVMSEQGVADCAFEMRNGVKDEVDDEEVEETEETPINTSSFWGGRVNKKQTSLDSFIRRRPKR